MTSNTPNSFLLGTWKIEPLCGSVVRAGGDPQHLEPKVMDVLVCLALRPNEVVTREELLDLVWEGNVVADEQLTRAISELRHAFNDEPGNPAFIETIPKRGYRLIREVRAVEYGSGDANRVSASPSSRFGERRVRMVGIALVLVALAYLAFERYGLYRAPELTVVGEKSIAVLPFVNMSEEQGAEYLSDGFCEDIISLLSVVPGLKVIGRTSSFSFKGKNEDRRVIGQKLGVTTLLDGSVRKSGNTVRIEAQLIDVADGSHIWSGSYDRNLSDMFDVQDQIVSSVVDALDMQVTELSDRDPPTTSSEAYTAFLKGRVAINRLEWSEAGDWLKKAIQLDRQFAEAYELLAYSYWYAAYNGADAEWAQKEAYEAASAAIAIDPDLIFAQRLYRSIPGVGPSDDLDASEWANRRLPGNPMVLDSLVYMYTYAGYKEEALQIARQYAEVDPLSIDANLDLFGTLYSVGRVGEALQILDIVNQIGLGPSNWQWTIAGALVNEGDNEAAIDYFEALLLLHGYTDLDWVRELVVAAQDPDAGQVYLDKRIPEIAASLSEGDSFNWQIGLVNWYLYFGFIDRYFDLILAAKPEIGAWAEAEEHVWHGHVFGKLGFTAHPDYLRFVTDRGIVEVWEQRGPPDFCRKTGDSWTSAGRVSNLFAFKLLR